MIYANLLKQLNLRTSTQESIQVHWTKKCKISNEIRNSAFLNYDQTHQQTSAILLQGSISLDLYRQSSILMLSKRNKGIYAVERTKALDSVSTSITLYYRYCSLHSTSQRGSLIICCLISLESSW